MAKRGQPVETTSENNRNALRKVDRKDGGKPSDRGRRGRSTSSKITVPSLKKLNVATESSTPNSEELFQRNLEALNAVLKEFASVKHLDPKVKRVRAPRERVRRETPYWDSRAYIQHLECAHPSATEMTLFEKHYITSDSRGSQQVLKLVNRPSPSLVEKYWSSDTKFQLRSWMIRIVPKSTGDVYENSEVFVSSTDDESSFNTSNSGSKIVEGSKKLTYHLPPGAAVPIESPADVHVWITLNNCQPGDVAVVEISFGLYMWKPSPLPVAPMSEDSDIRVD